METHEQEDSGTMNQAIALAELVTYIEDTQAENEIVPVFKLKNLVRMYSTKVEQLGTSLNGHVNSTHLKNRLLAHFPYLQAHKDGQDIFLVFNEAAMRKACEHDADSNAIHLAWAAKIVCGEPFNNKSTFTGTYGNQLVVHTKFIIGGITFYDLVWSKYQNPVKSLVETSGRNDSSHTVRHNEERETPLPQYLGVLIHSKTRKRV